ncbi:hypothetical protein HC931_18710 [Candidatus Gracilibacteria bacterium]|jgi:hypothetical protein|nr:hypothetical protein [Candidatus Gracilibacteria bacterium]NJM87236.1 hypothetical protein [Hydrococcus sp. RU_2_2]NJP18650.1 hypothetical protein [Hydrococcus sp. CRU_1_1]
MATDDRKKRIMEHLAMSSDAIKSIAPKSISKQITLVTPETPTPTPEPIPVPTSVKISDARSGKTDWSLPALRDRKRRIMEHVNRTSEDLGDLSQEEKKRKQQVLDHVRKSQS